MAERAIRRPNWFGVKELSLSVTISIAGKRLQHNGAQLAPELEPHVIGLGKAYDDKRTPFPFV